MKHITPVIAALSIYCFFSCENKKAVLEMETYDGPVVILDSVDILISDSAKIKMRLVAPKQLVYDNDDKDFPDGIYLEFYNPLGAISSTLVANKAYYFSDGDYYKAEGNVQMLGVDKNDELHSEVLNWSPKEERIYTDEFVTIKSDGEVLKGEGLEASEDFNEYTILNPQGVMVIDPTDNSPVSAEPIFDEDLVYEEDTTVYEEDLEK